MKQIELLGLEKTLYYDTLKNGLDVYLLPYDDKKNYFISYATKYGSDVLIFKMGKEDYVPPKGIAHFLEHKMFEEESGEDPFTFFSCSGTDSNASTSYDNTQYICYGTKNFEENLRFLIKFVNRPYFTDENVLKEKGIIAEEIKMYQDMPDYQLEMHLRDNLYHNCSRKYDIAGSIDDINKITVEDLYKCYNSFYVPNNMFILIVGAFDVDKTIGIIHSELDKVNSQALPNIIKDKEEESVLKKKDTIKGNVEIPKIGIGIKVSKDRFKLKGNDLDLYLNMITTIMFGSSSEFRERVRRDNLLNDIYLDWEDTDNYKTFYIMASTIDPDKLINEIQYEFNNASIQKNTLERIKKVWIANEVKIVDSIERMENNLFDDIISYGKVINNRIDRIRKMSLSNINDCLKAIDFNNQCVIKMISKEKKDDIN